VPISSRCRRRASFEIRSGSASGIMPLLSVRRKSSAGPKPRIIAHWAPVVSILSISAISFSEAKMIAGTRMPSRCGNIQLNSSMRRKEVLSMGAVYPILVMPATKRMNHRQLSIKFCARSAGFDCTNRTGRGRSQCQWAGSTRPGGASNIFRRANHPRPRRVCWDRACTISGSAWA